MRDFDCVAASAWATCDARVARVKGRADEEMGSLSSGHGGRRKVPKGEVHKGKERMGRAQGKGNQFMGIRRGRTYNIGLRRRRVLLGREMRDRWGGRWPSVEILCQGKFGYDRVRPRPS